MIIDDTKPPKDRGKVVLVRQPMGFGAAVVLYDLLKPRGYTGKIKKRKGVCKNRKHEWLLVMKKIEIWPYEVQTHRQCVRCGRKEAGSTFISE